MHFLESLTFVPKIQDAIVKEFRTTLGMFLGEFRETPCRFVAGFGHCFPPRRNLFQILFLSDA